MKARKHIAWDVATAVLPLRLSAGDERGLRFGTGSLDVLLQASRGRNKQIGELARRNAKDHAELPKYQIVTEKDNPFTMAVKFLKTHCLFEENSRTLVVRTNTLEGLRLGWHVCHQDLNGTCGHVPTRFISPFDGS